MRILIKWCEELESNLQTKNLYEREESFRMQNGKESFLPSSRLTYFGFNLYEQDEEIEDYRRELLENNYE